ncbi:penicillin acylase family protein [Roseobacter sp. N2S]|uniref:penicillin acylase family protein n=1 Tax=Roseobacter sp. N2S TaxID=2663844 RepID=UPI0028564080|nr:penicillin acylase family protein [Roseobacter sp. N2S]MDR6265392.1 penicillin amidase [Roseobacter sp. N2S]
MAVAFRWLLRGFLGLVLLITLALLLVYYFATRSIPDYNADYSLRGLNGPVEIVRDTNDVPHIFADQPNDVYFGLGFAHAQDRLWQMTMLRRTAQGRLSELFGAETAKIDDFVRRLDLADLSRASFEYQTEEVKDALRAYSAGVNAWLSVVQKDALGRGAPEFFLFSPEIEPWTPADSLSILRVMALQLSGHLRNEIVRAQVTLAVGKERVRDILPDAPGKGAVALPEYASLFDTFGEPPTKFAALEPQNPLDPVAPFEMAGASNAWAAASARSATGAPILANDPHLGLSAPSIWMLARMEFPDGGVIGGTIPGIPVILSGRSAALGWGLTSSTLDDLDVYVERVNPENPDEYLTPDGYKPFRKQQVLIRIKDEAPRTAELRWTDNGPVIPPNQYDLGSITPPGHVTSIHWAALDANDQSMTAAINLMRAKSIPAARAALSFFKSPSQNVTLADKNGVMLQMVGKQPARDPAHRSQGRYPSQGWLPENRWNGYLPFEDNPYVRDPASGIVANTNNKITDKPFPRHVSYSWGDTYRFLRLSSLMNDREVHTRDSFIEAQLDTGSFAAVSLLPLVAKELWFTGEAAPAGTPDRQRQIALELLAAWNGQMDEHIPEPLIYAAWMRQLQSRLIRDELSTLADHFPRPDPVFLERVFRNVENANVWCDIRQSTKVETCADIARLSLDAALIELTEKYGTHIESWRWGQAHQAHHDHQVLGDVPLLSWFANIRQETSGGDQTLMRGVTKGTGAEPYANVHAAGFRSVIDFSDPDSSVYVISTGQSGHFLSRHYDDLAGLWRRGEYILMSLDPDLARGGAVGISHLTPAQPK